MKCIIHNIYLEVLNIIENDNNVFSAYINILSTILCVVGINVLVVDEVRLKRIMR